MSHVDIIMLTSSCWHRHVDIVVLTSPLWYDMKDASLQWYFSLKSVSPVSSWENTILENTWQVFFKHVKERLGNRHRMEEAKETQQVIVTWIVGWVLEQKKGISGKAGKIWMKSLVKCCTSVNFALSINVPCFVKCCC